MDACGPSKVVWDQFVEVGCDAEVLGVEGDLREEKDEEHCNIRAIEVQGFRGERSWP